MKSHYLKILVLNISIFLQLSATSKLFILSGPSGVGKTTIINHLVQKNLAKFCPTTTTRPMRDGEQNGIDYFFVTKEKFESRCSEFIQPKEIFGNWYGPDRVLLEHELKESQKIIVMVLTSDVIKHMKEAFPGHITNIFVAPPMDNAREILVKRLRNRRETEESIQKRLDNLEQELQQVDYADYCLINDDLKKTLSDIEQLIQNAADAKRVRYAIS